MSALPHIGQTVRNRRDLRVLRGAKAYAEHQRYTDPSLDWEMQRAARTELLPAQPEPVMFRAPVEDDPIALAEGIRLLTIGFLAIAALLAFGLLVRDPVAYVLARLGVLS
jgi:hypothetical protein